MSVHKDKERGTWYFVVRIYDYNGKRKQIKRRGFAKKKEAKEAEAKFLLEHENKDDATFKEVAESYYNWYAQRRKQSSVNVIKNIIYNHLMDEFGHKELDEITPNDVMKYQNRIIRQYAPEFLKKIHTTLSAIFNFGIKFHGTQNNPAKIAGNFELEDERKIVFWEHEEFQQFIEVVEDKLYRAFFMTLYYSGARKGELLALTWNDIDFEEGALNINKTLYNREVTKPKTKASIREILLPSYVMGALNELRKNPYAPLKGRYVVFGEFYDPISTTTLDRKYAQYVKEAGVEKIRLHDFRHSHASYLIDKGASPHVVAARLGHSDVATTLNTYSHLYPSKQKEIVELMESE